MKKTDAIPNGTSFHNVVINATPKQLREILGEPTYEQNDGSGKVNMEWVMLTDEGEIFTVYDWKQ